MVVHLHIELLEVLLDVEVFETRLVLFVSTVPVAMRHALADNPLMALLRSDVADFLLPLRRWKVVYDPIHRRRVVSQDRVGLLVDD